MKILISTIPKGYGGAGDYLGVVMERYRKEGYHLLTPWLASKLIGRDIFRVAYFLDTIFIKLISLLLSFMKNESVVIYHPQTIGYSLSTRLIEGADRVIFYLLDSVFFCIKSYNCRKGHECLNCIRGVNIYGDCVSFPRNASIESYKDFNRALRKFKTKTVFVCQNNQQRRLLHDSISGANSKIEKMITSELLGLQDAKCTQSEFNYDFCFHGNMLDAKGYSFAIELSKELEGFSFVFPFKNNNTNIKNVTYQPCSWSSGLKELVCMSKIVLCPSLWSTPVESAVIKSMLLGKVVAIVENKYSLAKDLPNDVVIKLTGNIHTDALMLKCIITNEAKIKEIGNKARKWARRYVQHEV